MSDVRPMRWESATMGTQWPSEDEASNFWLNTSYQELFNLAHHETLIRTRLSMTLAFGVECLTPAVGRILPLWYQSLQVNVGVYCQPEDVVHTAPPGIPQSPVDPGWVLYDMLTVHQIHIFADPSTSRNTQEVIMKLDAGSNQSFGKRGPAIQTGGCTISLGYNIFADNLFWGLHDSQYEGAMGGSATVSCLIQGAPV